MFGKCWEAPRVSLVNVDWSKENNKILFFEYTNIYQGNAWGFWAFTKHLPGKQAVFAIFTSTCLRGSCLGWGRCPKMLIAHQRLKCVMPVVAAMCSCSVSGSAFSRHRCRNRGTVGGRKNQTRKWVWWSGAPLVRERFFCSPLSPITMLKKGTPFDGTK